MSMNRGSHAENLKFRDCYVNFLEDMIENNQFRDTIAPFKVCMMDKAQGIKSIKAPEIPVFSFAIHNINNRTSGAQASKIRETPSESLFFIVVKKEDKFGEFFNQYYTSEEDPSLVITGFNHADKHVDNQFAGLYKIRNRKISLLWPEEMCILSGFCQSTSAGIKTKEGTVNTVFNIVNADFTVTAP